MKNVILNKTRLVALTLAAATLVAPFTANAQFSSRSNNNNAGAQVAGGLIGGSIGAILGEEVAGRRNRTEGAVLGAIIGGVAGAAIGDGIADDNSRSNRGFTNNRGFTSNRGFTNNRGFNNRGVSTQVVIRNNGFGNSRINSQRFGYGQQLSANTFHKIDKIDYRLETLKYEQDDIYAALKYDGRNRRYLKKRLIDIECEIDELKDRRRFLKRSLRKNIRSNSFRRGY